MAGLQADGSNLGHACGRPGMARVVGQSVGLPTLFTLAAALIGGNLFGLVGMIFFTPIFAVIYRLVREFVVEKEERNESGEVA